MGDAMEVRKTFRFFCGHDEANLASELLAQATARPDPTTNNASQLPTIERTQGPLQELLE
jgi:hypothetical protein